MKPISADTTPEAQRMHFEMMRTVPGWKRLNLALELTQATRTLILADLRNRFPHATPKEIRRRFIARVLSRDEVVRAFGFDPEREGY